VPARIPPPRSGRFQTRLTVTSSRHVRGKKERSIAACIASGERMPSLPRTDRDETRRAARQRLATRADALSRLTMQRRTAARDVAAPCRACARGLMSRTSKPIVLVYQSAIGNTGLMRIITGERMLQGAGACRLKFCLAIARADKPRRHSII